MKQYEAYKDSGIQWLGEIPSHWTALKLKYICAITDGTHFSPATKSEGRIYVTVSNVYDDEIHLENASRISEEDFQNLVRQGCQPKVGDVLLAKDGTVGRSAIVVDNDFVALSSLGILSPGEQISSSFLKYSLDSLFLQEQMNAAMAGSALRRITISKICEFIGIIPPLAEQEVIAAYLDLKVGQIDAILSEKEAMVEQLQQYRKSLISENVTRGLNPNVPMKDSGIDWIGQIPAHWQLVKLKSIAKVNGRIGYRGYTTEDLVHDGNGAYAIGGKHISKCVLDLSHPDFISWEKYYESPEIMVKKGDLLMAQRGSLGKVALVRDNIGEATINPSLVLINNLKIGDVFLYYYLVSNSCLTYIELLNTATAVPMISQNQIENLFVPVPPVVEQHAISTFLDKKTNELDTAISELQSQIEDLKAYKSSVISEAVTGKVDLRDWKPSEDNA